MTAQTLAHEQPASMSIVMPRGLLGFEDTHNYRITADVDGPLHWLQSEDNQAVAFPLIDPFLLLDNYEFEIPDADVEALGLSGPSDVLVFVILTFRDAPLGVTANLQAPLIINRATGASLQVVLDEAYPLRFPIRVEQSSC